MRGRGAWPAPSRLQLALARLSHRGWIAVGLAFSIVLFGGFVRTCADLVNP